MTKQLKISLITSLLLAFIFSCTNNQKPLADENAVVDKKDDALSMMQNYLCGLWSYDSANILNNEGYFFKPDGTVDFVASEYTGEWKMLRTDSLIISYSFYSEHGEIEYKIKSMTADQMILADADGEYIFRKVPFGMNDQESVITGFHGTLSPEDSREYNFDLPSAKKIRITLRSDNPKMTMRIFDQFKEVTSADVQAWQSIMVRSGKYKVVVSLPKGAGKENEDFDLKVYGN
ncbi:MAG: hypothetical protein IPP51_11390 [Bacteroidetes bacterium]|nr:hypothetical protein [Bacteroidota bacterium]